MAKTKYFYEQGFCAAWHLNGHWPVKYESEDKVEYHKVEMVCSAISEGRCTQKENCDLFAKAKETIPATNHMLYDKIIGR